MNVKLSKSSVHSPANAQVVVKAFKARVIITFIGSYALSSMVFTMFLMRFGSIRGLP